MGLFETIMMQNDWMAAIRQFDGGNFGDAEISAFAVLDTLTGCRGMLRDSSMFMADWSFCRGCQT